MSSELFQKHLNVALDNLNGVIGVTDDITVYGAGETIEESARDHNKNIIALLNRCRSVGIKPNKEKAEIKMDEITFLSHRITSKGLRIDPDKVRAIKVMKKPEIVEDVRRFCGFVNYLSRFLPRLAHTLEPIRQLMHKDTKWGWYEKT